MLRGGEGDDIIYGAFDTDMSAGGGGTNYFIYGDEGNDTIWGKQNMNEYIWGGSGDDEIHGGTRNNIIHIDTASKTGIQNILPHYLHIYGTSKTSKKILKSN